MRGIYYSALILAGLSVFFQMPGCNQTNKRVVISTNDAVALPGETVPLNAKLEQRNILLKDIKKAPLCFRMISSPGLPPKDWNKKVITDHDGRATTSITVLSEGLYEIEISYDGNRRFRPRSDVATILTLSKEKPVLILDVDGTLSRESWLDSEEIPPTYDQDTAEVVNELSKTYAIVYLSARPTLLHSRTRKWLEENHFPKGPILLWYPKRIKWLSPEEYKEDILIKMKKSGINLSVGIGNAEGDIDAYRKAGMKAIWLRKKGERYDDMEEESTVVFTWSEIRKAFQK